MSSRDVSEEELNVEEEKEEEVLALGGGWIMFSFAFTSFTNKRNRIHINNWQRHLDFNQSQKCLSNQKKTAKVKSFRKNILNQSRE